MTDEPNGKPPRGLKCPTEGCLGNCWSVFRTFPCDGGVARVRICGRCGARLVTYERPAFSSGSMPLRFIWMRS